MKSLFILLLSLPAFAGSWNINKDHSEIFFQVSYLEVSDVTGRFTQFNGSAEFSKDGELQGVQLIIDPQSIDTGQRQRDGHLRAQDFLYTKKHSHITYESHTVQRLGPHRFQVTGPLTIRGISRSVSLELSLTAGQQDSWGFQNKFVKFKSQLNRKDFGINWNKTLLDSHYLVGEKVRFWGSLQIQPVNKVTPTSKHMIPDTPAIRAREQLKRGEISEAEYHQSIGSVDGSLNQPLPPAVTKAPITVVERTIDPRQRLSWQLWFWLLGLLGFAASIVLGIHGKQWSMQLLGEHYAENGFWGHASDLITIGITLLYATAFWYVGWG